MLGSYERFNESNQKVTLLGLTYDDVLLLPDESDVVPSEVNTRTRLSRHIELDIPILSSAMDTVTEAKMAIALAKAGGIGIVHRNLSIEDQVRNIVEVKKHGRVGAAVLPQAPVRGLPGHPLRPAARRPAAQGPRGTGARAYLPARTGARRVRSREPRQEHVPHQHEP